MIVIIVIQLLNCVPPTSLQKNKINQIGIQNNSEITYLSTNETRPLTKLDDEERV